MTLFRDDALAEQRHRLHGDVTIHQPVAFGTMTGLLVTFAIAVAGAAGLASFSRKETAIGWISPELGMAETFAPAGALVQAIEVKVGQRVSKGDVLGSLSMETYDATGSVSQHEGRQIALQQSEVATQMSAVRHRTQTEIARIRSQTAGIRTIMTSIDRQKQVQSAQLDLSRRQMEALAPLVAKGFGTKLDQQRRESAFLSIKQAIIELEQQASTQANQLASLEAQITAAENQQAFDLAQLKMTQAGLASTAVSVASRAATTLRSPVSGTIAAVNVGSGETIRPGMPVVSIAPPGNLRVDAFIPTKAAGFVTPGQRVVLFVDAFPYQRYGTLNGVVEEIGNAAINPGEYGTLIKVTEPSYRLRIRIEPRSGSVLKPLPIRAGMSVSASITTERRTILQWLFDPLAKASATLIA